MNTNIILLINSLILLIVSIVLIITLLKKYKIKALQHQVADLKAVLYKTILIRNEVPKNNKLIIYDLKDFALRFNFFVNNINDIIFSLDHNYNLKFISQSVLKNTGYTATEIATLPATKYLSKKTLVKFLKQLNNPAINESNDNYFCLQVKHKNGTSFWFEISINVTTNLKTNQKEFIGIARNMDNRIKSDNFDRVYLKAIENSPVVIIITDNKGDIKYVNPHFEKVTQYAFSEVENKNPRLLKPENVGSGTFEDMWKTISSGKHWTGELKNRKKSGDEFWAIVSINPVFNHADQIIYYVAVEEDITQLKQTIFDYEITTRKLLNNQQNQEKILRILNHDIKSGVTNIMSMSAMIAEAAKITPDSQPIAEYNKMISKNAFVFYHLVDNLYKYIHTQKPKSEPRFATLDSQMIIWHNLELMNSIIVEKEILINQNAIECFYLYADEDFLNTVFRNILYNALQNSAQKTELLIYTSVTDKNPDHINFHILNNGKEFSPKLLEFLSEMMDVHGANALLSKTEKSIGIPLSYQLMQKMEGDLLIKNLNNGVTGAEVIIKVLLA